MRHVAAGYGDAFVGAGVGVEIEQSLEALLNFSYTVQVDKEPAVDAEESLALKLPFKSVEASGCGQEPSMVAHQPDMIVVGLREADLGRIQQNPPVLPQAHHPAMGGSGAGISGVGDGVARCDPWGQLAVGRSEREQRTDNLSSRADRVYRDREGSAEEGHEDLR